MNMQVSTLMVQPILSSDRYLVTKKKIKQKRKRNYKNKTNKKRRKLMKNLPTLEAEKLGEWICRGLCNFQKKVEVRLKVAVKVLVGTEGLMEVILIYNA